MNFAKMFDTEHGQVVVMLQPDDGGDPEVRFYSKPDGFDVCSMAFGYSGNWDRAEEGFAKIDITMAAQAALQIRKVTCDA